jgi:hypothetical protein
MKTKALIAQKIAGPSRQGLGRGRENRSLGGVVPEYRNVPG